MARFATQSEIRQGTVQVRIDEALGMLQSCGGYEALRQDEEAWARYRDCCPAGGSVVGSFAPGTVQALDTDCHIALVASSGRKKTRAQIIPTVAACALAGQPLVVNDMKGEILTETQGLLKAAGYRVLVLDFRKPAASPNCYNLLTLAYDAFHQGDEDAATVIVGNVAEILFDELATVSDDVYWSQMASDYFVGLAMARLQSWCKREEFTLESIYDLDAQGDIYVEALVEVVASDAVKRSVVGTLSAPNQTKASIKSVFLKPGSTFCSLQGLTRMMARSDFAPTDLAQERTALFILSPDESGTMAPIVTAVISQILSALVTAAVERGGRLAHPVQIILDEFGNLRRIPNFEHIVSAGRSRGLRLHLVLQSTAQLAHVYGRDLKDVIVGNIYDWIFLGTRDVDFLEEFSRMLGTVTAPSGRQVPRVSESSLGLLEKRKDESEAVCLLGNLAPYVATLPDYASFAPFPQLEEEVQPAALLPVSAPEPRAREEWAQEPQPPRADEPEETLEEMIERFEGYIRMYDQQIRVRA